MGKGKSDLKADIVLKEYWSATVILHDLEHGKQSRPRKSDEK